MHCRSLLGSHKGMYPSIIGRGGHVRGASGHGERQGSTRSLYTIAPGAIRSPYTIAPNASPAPMSNTAATKIHLIRST